MSSPEAEKAEKAFLIAASRRIPGVQGYREPAPRRETDAKLREVVCGQLGELAEKVEALKAEADEDGDADMADDLDQLKERVERTAHALESATHEGFLGRGAFEAGDLVQVHTNDAAMMEDMDLLIKDLSGLKYEAIGTLTLREVEGTLASIELKISNRKHLLEDASE